MKNYNNEQCLFFPIEIVYLKKKQSPTHCSVTFRLAKSFRAQLSYPALCDAIDNYSIRPNADDVFSSVVYLRNSKLPNPYEIPNAGSF